MTFPRFAPWNSMIGDSTLTPRVTTHEVKEEGRKATPTKSSGSKCNCRTQAIPHANISSSTSAARSFSPLGKNVPNRYCQKSSFRRNENTFSAPSIILIVSENLWNKLWLTARHDGYPHEPLGLTAWCSFHVFGGYEPT